MFNISDSLPSENLSEIRHEKENFGNPGAGDIISILL